MVFWEAPSRENLSPSSSAVFIAVQINIDLMQPVFRDGGWVSGAYIKPFILYKLMQLKQAVSIPIIGLGGVCNGHDALEMLLAGASAIGIVSAVILSGPELIARINKQITDYLEKHHLEGIESLSGALLPSSDSRSVIYYDAQKCSFCGRCAAVCCYGARKVNGNMSFHSDRCKGCGLCVSVCRNGALT